MKKLWEGITDYIDDIIWLSWEMKLLFGLIILAVMSSIFPQIKVFVRIGWILLVALPICLYELLAFVERIKQKRAAANGTKRRKKKNRLLKLLEDIGGDIFWDMMNASFVVHVVLLMMIFQVVFIIKNYEIVFGVIMRWIDFIAR